MNPRSVTRFVLLWVLLSAFAPSAFAIYINPLHADGNAVARRIPTTDFPSVGFLSSAVGNCTGTLVHSNILRAPAMALDPWVLTAGHCLEVGAGPAGPLPADNGVSFRPTGRYVNNDPTMGNIAAITSDRVRRHSDYGFPNNDIGLFRLNPATNAESMAITNAGVSQLMRLEAGTAPAVGTALTSIGLGNANAGGGWAGGGGDKRLFTSAVTAQAVGASNGFQYAQPGNGTNANPTRHICAGDSGGPSFTAMGLVGVHSSTTGEVADCDGTAVDNQDANVTLPFLFNYIDSYSRKGIFWDELRADGVIKDMFEPGGTGYQRGLTGLADGWELKNNGTVIHPNYGPIGPNPTGWRYFNAIGNNNASAAELYTDGASSTGEIMLGGGPSVIERLVRVPFGGVVALTVRQRWNSLGLADDFGVRVPPAVDPTGVVWDGYAESAAGTLDAWFTRTLEVNTTWYPEEPDGMVSLRVLLLNVPEPATVTLLALGAVFAMRVRFRR